MVGNCIGSQVGKVRNVSLSQKFISIVIKMSYKGLPSVLAGSQLPENKIFRKLMKFEIYKAK